MDKLLSSLPYQLTEDQQAAVDGMLRHIGSGQRLNALLQGDVGCGKTIVAFLMLCAIISSGCQGVLVAPTRQLASQHYQDMQELLVPLGIQVGYLGDATSKKAQRRKVLEGLADGSIQIAVGTHALFSPSVKFHDLGMVIVDEEHKFGVLQRESLVARANAGVHCITMSATPIPRSLAIAMYGSGLQVYSILTRPKGRMPVKTLAVAPDEMDRLNSFLRYQAASGHQTYVVCPAIEHGTSERMENVISVEQAYDWLKCFEAEGIHTEVLTGRTLKTESAEILERFRKNETQILLATSVIEVGINVPSATGIIILSAERFGLASLHQLRGRVGRGADQGYCIVYSPEAHSNPRLQALCKTTDGFKIAEEDLRLRGAGDFLGTQQSGDNRYVSLMLANPDKFQDIRKLARMSIDQNMNYPLMERAVADFRKPPEAD
jgi:ATP-dependent DNA helicase RecG